MNAPKATASILYWYLVIFLVGFGLLAIASIGLPFLILGLALAALGPTRARPRLFWPVLAGIAGFLIGFALVAPFSCQSTSASGGPGIPPQALESTTQCRSLTGISYSGEPDYRPPIWPAVAAGAVSGAGALLTARRITRVPEQSGMSEAPA